MDATNNIAKDLFYKIRSRFSGLKLGNDQGVITINPDEARFFDFDYMEGEKAVGHVTISLAETNSMKVYFSSGITESMDSGQKKNWYTFLRELRQFAKRRLMAFDTRDITKDNLDQRDFAFLSQNAKSKEENTSDKKSVGESIMNESQLYGTNRVSYQRLMDTRLIIKHSKTLQDDQQPGARSRNISALFVENQDGERFKYPFIHLAGARAMQRHVANGGVPYDDIGKSIISMSEQIAQLKSFGNYVVRNDLMNSDTNSIVERSAEALGSLREQIAKLSKQNYYEHYKENFQQLDPVEIPQSVVEEFKDKFTIRSFREEISTVFPLLYKIMQEQNSVDYDDIVDMTTLESINDQAVIEEDEDYFERFEQWVMDLGESSPLQSDEDQIQAIEDLNKMIAQAFPAGVDGTNAIQSLKGIIDDPNLFKEIKDAARQNPQEDVRPMIKAWVDQNATTIADQLDFGDMEQAATEPAAEEPAADAGTGDAAAAGDAAVAAATGGEEQTVTQSDDNVSRGESKKLNVQELAEFIQSFYDRESGTFPKGPEGVCTMVGKKFGEQAESVARKFVERMAPQQATENNPELQELARIRDLAGLEKKNLTTFESSSDRYDYDVDQHETEVALVFDRDAAGNPTNVKVMLGKADITPVVDRAWLDETIPEMSRDEQSPSTGYPMDLNIGINYRIYGQDRPATREDPPEYAELEIEDIDVLGNGKSVAININDLGRDAGEKIEQDLWDDARDRAEADRDYYDPPYESQSNTELDDLTRIRELAGMQSEAGGYDPDRHPQTKDYGTGDEDEDEEDEDGMTMADRARRDGRGGDDAEDGDGMKEGDRIRDISPEDDEDDADAADEDYVYDLANRIFSMDPNLSAKGLGDEVVDAAYEHMVRDLGKKRASYILRHDPDFVGELLDTYSQAQHHSKLKGEDIRSVSPELEDIRRLSGIAKGISY